MSSRKANIVLVTMLTIHLHFLQSDAASVVTTNGSLDEINDLICGSDVVIICTTQPTPNKVIWTIDNVWVADCTFGICTESSSIPTFYSFSHNTTGGVFHLNIRPVSFQQNGKSFACEEGTGPPNTLTTEVNVLPHKSDSILTESNTQLVITTGCVYPVTNITFEWYIFKVGMEAVPYTKQEPVQTFNNSGCSLGECGHGEAARVSSTLNIPYVEKGELYYFQVIVRHTATSRDDKFNSKDQYRINDGGNQCIIECDTVCRLLIAIGVCFFIYVIVGCLLLYVMLILTKQDENTEKKIDTSHIEVILNTISIIMWIVIVILFILALCHCCCCEEPCCCCKIVLILRYVLGILFGIHVILWLILLYVLYNRKVVEDVEGNIYFKTKLMKVRIVFSTIPMVGLFPVCGWLIRIYRYGNRITHDKQLTLEEKTLEPPKPECGFKKNRTEDNRNKPQKRLKKGQDQINQYFEQIVDSGEDHKEQMNDDQLSASEITIVKPKATDTKNNANIQKGQSTRRARTQLSQNNRNVLTRSQDHNTEHEKNMPDNQNHGPHSDENPQRKIDDTNKQSRSNNKPDEVNRKKGKSWKETDENKRTKTSTIVTKDAHTGQNDETNVKSGSKNKSDSKDEVTPKQWNSRKETDENKSTKNTEFAATGNTQVAKTGSGDTLDSRDADSPLDISKSDNTVPNREKSRKNKNEKEGPNNTKSFSTESHNGSEPVKRALSAIFDDEKDDTPTVSIDSNTKM